MIVKKLELRLIFLFIYDNSVFLVGGYDHKKQVQSISFDGVNDLNEAKPGWDNMT